MKIQATDIRVGYVVEIEGRQYAIVKTQHIEPGRRQALIQLEMRDVHTGTKTNKRLSSGDNVEKLSVEEKECQYLFTDGELLTFMDNETYEQFTLPQDALGDALPFLQDGMQVQVNFIEDKPISVKLPQKVICEIVETEPVIKGQTATSSFKPAVLDNGVRTMVPQFLEVGEKIVVTTEDAAYVERAKK